MKSRLLLSGLLTLSPLLLSPGLKAADAVPGGSPPPPAQSATGSPAIARPVPPPPPPGQALPKPERVQSQPLSPPPPPAPMVPALPSGPAPTGQIPGLVPKAEPPPPAPPRPALSPQAAPAVQPQPAAPLPAAAPPAAPAPPGADPRQEFAARLQAMLGRPFTEAERRAILDANRAETSELRIAHAEYADKAAAITQVYRGRIIELLPPLSGFAATPVIDLRGLLAQERGMELTGDEQKALAALDAGRRRTIVAVRQRYIETLAARLPLSPQKIQDAMTGP